jgi:putative ABC transport system substrate-binding protein
VLVVNTNSEVDRYQRAAAAFTASLSGVETVPLDLTGEANPVDILQDLMNARKFDAVYCIGAKALGSVDYIDRGIPVVYSSVLNWRQFAGQPNYFGVASEVAPEAQLAWFKYFFPELRKVGVLYSEANRKLIADAHVSAGALSMELEAVEIEAPTQLVASLTELARRVDVIWLISDPIVLSSPANTQKMFAYANERKIPVFAYNRFFVDLGAVLSITADLPTTGRQAALIMQKLLSRGQIPDSVQFPAGTTITLNMDKARDYQLKLNESALDSVNEIIGR